jgi:DNA polymerase III epsilon subunit-like protein
VRVERGAIVGEFRSLVRPDQRPVSAGAQATHGFGAAELAVAPTFAEVWPRFREFIGASVLVAHNGLNFDVPVLRRMAQPLGGAERLQVFDTLPLARSLSRDSSKLSDLAARFGVPLGRAHHALDDAKALVGVYEALEARRVVRSRKASLANLLPFVGLALVLDVSRTGGEEVPLLVKLAAPFSLGRFTDCLEVYDAERERLGAHGPTLDEVIQRLGGKRMMEKLHEERDAAERYPEAIARLEALLQQEADESLDDAIIRFLERVALSRSDGTGAEAHRVNLLTLHSTKGLEFSRVYIVGVEDEQLPGWIPRDEDTQHAIEESRRLLYVGMTRAVDRLVLTRVDRRAGKPGGASRFLDEMKLELERLSHPEHMVEP